MAAITLAEYNRISQKGWIGVRLRSLRPIVTRIAELPAGTLWTVEQKFGGFAVVSDPCPHCGIKVNVVKAQPQAFERV